MSIFNGAASYFVRGGVCMWPLLICSLAGIMIGVERYLYYNKVISRGNFIAEFCSKLNALDRDGAKDLANNTKGDAAKLAAEILDADGDFGKRLEAVVFSKADRYVESWQQYLNYLNVIVGLSPMLGLLGTITGMMAAFNALNERTQNPMAVTAGIGEALITTVFGLCIAIVGMCIYTYLTSRVRSASLNIYEVANVLTDVMPVCNCMQVVEREKNNAQKSAENNRKII